MDMDTSRAGLGHFDGSAAAVPAATAAPLHHLGQPTSSSSSAPAAAAIGGNELDVRWLQKRLEMMTDWHERAQETLARMQGLPNDTRRLRHFVENPDIAIPLLQNYDAAILEKEEQIADLQRQVQAAKVVAERAETEYGEAHKAAHVADERTNVAAEQLRQERAHKEAVISQLTTELQQARDAATHAVDVDAKQQHSISKLEKMLLEKDQSIQKLQSRLTDVETSLETAAKKLRNVQQNEDASRNDNEAAKIQLHLVQKENDDKVHEIERLRNKMVQALKMSAENHATHLRLVEDKHREAIEQLREENRTGEVTIMKLRAQLAHADVVASGPNGSVTSSVPSAYDVMASQAVKAQEAELRRLQGEVTAVQMQRDDAVFRMEQAASQHRADVESKVLDAKKEVELLKIRNHELEERNNRLQVEAQSARDTLRQERDRSRSIASEQSTSTAQKEALTRKLEEAKKLQQQSEEAVERLRRENQEALETERKQVRGAERRLDDARRSEQQLKDKHTAETTDYTRELEALRGQLRTHQAKVTTMQQQLFEKERVIESLTVKTDRLNQGLNAHKQQLAAADERVKRLTAHDNTAREELRTLSLHCEQLRMENGRLSRERNRIAQDHEAMHQALRGNSF